MYRRRRVTRRRRRALKVSERAVLEDDPSGGRALLGKINRALANWGEAHRQYGLLKMDYLTSDLGRMKPVVAELSVAYQDLLKVARVVKKKSREWERHGEAYHLNPYLPYLNSLTSREKAKVLRNAKDRLRRAR